MLLGRLFLLLKTAEARWRGPVLGSICRGNAHACYHVHFTQLQDHCRALDKVCSNPGELACNKRWPLQGTKGVLGLRMCLPRGWDCERAGLEDADICWAAVPGFLLAPDILSFIYPQHKQILCKSAAIEPRSAPPMCDVIP